MIFPASWAGRNRPESILAIYSTMCYSSQSYMAIEVFKTKWLARFARRERLDDASLRGAIDRMERGIVDADLGGGLIKQRVARAGQGRSGGYRMLLAYRSGERAVFLYGFAKNERENIEDAELLTLREIGAAWLAADAKGIARALSEDALQEVKGGDEDADEPLGEGTA